MTQQDLANATGLALITVSRLCRGKNDKGGIYRPKPEVLAACAIALHLSVEEWIELEEAAFPERAVIREALQHCWNVVDAEIQLFDQQLPPLVQKRRLHKKR